VRQLRKKPIPEELSRLFKNEPINIFTMNIIPQ
jgi:hypothetical protein